MDFIIERKMRTKPTEIATTATPVYFPGFWIRGCQYSFRSQHL